MKIEVKNLKVNLAFSEETICFKSDIYINGIKCCYAENGGYGGSTYVHTYGTPMSKTLYNQAEDYLSKQPKKVITHHDRTWEQDQTLENFVDDYVADYVERKEKERFSKRINKDMQKGLIVSKDELKSYSLVSWKGKKINDLLSIQGGETVIKNTVDKYKAQGYTIYNTNLPRHILN